MTYESLNKKLMEKEAVVNNVISQRVFITVFPITKRWK